LEVKICVPEFFIARDVTVFADFLSLLVRGCPTRKNACAVSLDCIDWTGQSFPCETKLATSFALVILFCAIF
jgi:hypothetical protein